MRITLLPPLAGAVILAAAVTSAAPTELVRVDNLGMRQIAGRTFTLDRDYDGRMQRTFRGPVFVPTWWGNYDPTFRPASTGGTMAAPSLPTQVGQAPGSSSLPSLPGSDFAASIVGGIQNMSGQVLGNVTTFTSGVTNKTNPVPKTTSSGSSRSGGGGGRSCACACACAGCACACAGGGR